MIKRLSCFVDVLISRDPKIRSRLIFSWIAIYGYAAGSIVLGVAAHLGIIEAKPVWWLVGTIVVGVLGFYGMVRSGWSSRLGYQGMDFPQRLFALATMMGGYVVAGPLREGILPLVSLLLVFGVFTLTQRQVLIVGALTILCLGTVVSGMVVAGQYDGTSALLKFTLWAMILPALSAVTYYMAGIRNRMTQQKQELRHALVMLQEVAIRDDMTGLVNRRHMMQLLDLQQERQARTDEGFCVALIDLDHFKYINDHHGHHVGDEVLKDFALAAVSVLRQTDVLARWGGEEFLLMMPMQDPSQQYDQAIQALDRIRQQLMAMPTLPERPITFSAGVTSHPPGESLRETLERADRALYQAKAEGRARSVVLPPKASPEASDALFMRQ